MKGILSLTNCWLACMLLFISTATANDYVVSVQQFALEEGLAHYEVNAIFRDKDGFLWLAMPRNLQRYDGYEFSSYSLEAISHRKTLLNFMGQDEDGSIWFHFDPANQRRPTPLYFLNPLTGEIVDGEKRLGSTGSAQLAQLFDAEEQETILHHKNRLYFYQSNENQITVFDFQTGIQKINIPDFEGGKIRFNTIDSQGYFWLTDREFLFRISPDGGHSEKIRISPIAYDSRNKPNITNPRLLVPVVNEWENEIYFRKNNLAMGWVQCQIYRYEASGQHELMFTAPPDYYCIDVLDGQVWCIGKAGWKVFDLSGELLFELKQEDYKEYLFKFNNLIKSDRPNEYYITSDHGLNIIEVQKNRFTNYFAKAKGKSLPFYTNASRGIYAENDSVLVNFDRGGLVLFPKNNPDNYHILADHGVSIYADQAERPYYGIPIIRDATKQFWIGEYNYLSKWAPDFSKVEDILAPEALYQKGIRSTWSLFEDYNSQQDTCIWAADAFGLRKYCPDQKDPDSYRYEESGFKSKNIQVYQIFPDQQSRELLWLCTNDGLYVFDKIKGEAVHHYHQAGGDAYKLPTTEILHMHVDDQRTRWLGTREGLIRWNTVSQEKRLFNRNDGFSNQCIYAVYEDDYNRLWLSSDYGIMSFDKATFEVQIYLPKDGLAQTEFNRIAHFQDKEGTIYFGGMNGVTSFHPRDFQGKATDHSPVIISAFEIFDGEAGDLVNRLEEVTATKKVVFRPDDRFFKLKFVLPTAGDKSKTRYAWKVDGLFDEWAYQKENSLQFGVLPYGTHQLTIKGQTARSGWSPNQLVLNIHVLKPFYLQTWFLLLSVIAVGLGLFFLYKRRTALLKQRQRELEREIKKATAQITSDKEVIEEQAEELRQLDKVKSRFFANISHELRTPLTLILGPLSYILDKPDAWEKEEVQKQLLVMQRNGRSMLQLVEEILDLSKLEANKLELVETVTPVRQFVERIFWVFEPQFESLELIYRLHIDLQEEDLHVLMDRKKMEKVLNNYLSNAIKFTPKGNQISLYVTETESHIKIQVSDTGKGIHPGDMPFIFERFFQSKQAEQKLYGGTGIGLALVNEFARLMGGKAYAESTLGVGSQFYFELPKKRVDSGLLFSKKHQGIDQMEAEEALIAGIGHDFTIMVVEDSADMRKFVCTLLEKRFKRVLSAHHGAEGLEMLREYGTEIHLIVSDVMMPEVDGLTMLKEIKSHETWRAIPVIMLTALAAERDKLNALTIGVDDYLTKPFSVAELLTRAQNLLYNYHQRRKIAAVPDNQGGKEPGGADSVPVGALGDESDWIIGLEEFVLNNIFSNTLTVEQLAAQVHVSVRHFRRKLKLATGLTPARFIKEVQLQKARRELESGEVLSVKEVAYSNGFEQASTFSKVFKARFGKAPSAYLV